MTKRTQLTCTAQASIRLLKGGWKIAEAEDGCEYVKSVQVSLSITGNKKHGYHLLMAPDGRSAADAHYDSIEDAMETATELFGVTEADWQ